MGEPHTNQIAPGDLHPWWDQLVDAARHSSFGFYLDSHVLLAVDDEVEQHPATWTQPIRLALTTFEDLLVISLRTSDTRIDHSTPFAALPLAPHPTPEPDTPPDPLPDEETLLQELLPHTEDHPFQLQLHVLNGTGHATHLRTLTPTRHFTNHYETALRNAIPNWPLTPDEYRNQAARMYTRYPTPQAIWTAAQAITWTT